MKPIMVLCLSLLFCSIVSSNGQTKKIALTLNSAIEIGVKNNQEIKISYGKLNASRGRFLSAISLSSPELSISHDNIPAGKNLNSYSEKTLEISQAVEFPTKYFLRGSKLTKETEIAENEYLLAKNAVISKVKSSYYNTIAIQEQMKIALENVAISEDFVKKAEIRLSVGEGTNLERLTAKVQYSEALNNVEVKKNHLIAAFAELSFAMGFGKSQTEEYNLTDTLGFPKFDFTLKQLTDALDNNPNVKVSNLRVGLSSVDKSLAWSTFLPDFNLVYSNNFFGQGGTNTIDNYSASIGITVPLWFMLDQRGRIKEATANVIVAKSESILVMNDVYTKIRSAFAEFKNEETQVNLYQKDILPQAEEIYRTASRSYEAGEITYIEFLEAQQTVINSRSNYIVALLSYNLSIVSIVEIVGNTL